MNFGLLFLSCIRRSGVWYLSREIGVSWWSYRLLGGKEEDVGIGVRE